MLSKKPCKSLTSGSPPLTRERRSRAISIKTNNGITPAYAGKTLSLGAIIGCPKDHPRLRGKDGIMFHAGMLDLGSPPLTRERQLVPKQYEFAPGITPAYAGKTANHLADLPVQQDHPRLRGKDKIFSAI